MSILSSLKHGLFWHHSLARLRRFGVTINPYFLVREGDGDLDADSRLELPAGYRVEQLKAEDARELQNLTNWATPDEVERRLQLGHLCIVLRHGDRFAGYTWADPNTVNDAACPYQLKRGEAYLYDAFVAEEFRGGGLASGMRQASYDALRQLGVRSFVSVSDYFNASSIKFKRRLAAKPERLYLLLALGGMRLGNWTLRHYQPGQSAEAWSRS